MGEVWIIFGTTQYNRKEACARGTNHSFADIEIMALVVVLPLKINHWATS